ncbi:putative holin [Fulvimonas yonginensis]|uniref:Holin n=1 Tax=Fulvimonas yonginensis TaxID=1495200 RepID=A0ABU8JA74_9GAMM
MASIKDRLSRAYEHFAAVLDGFGRMALWALLSIVVLLVIAVLFNPAKFGSYLWIVSKLSLAAVMGYGFDRAASPDARPSQLEGIERAMAQTRRATLMAATIIAAGLMP